MGVNAAHKNQHRFPRSAQSVAAVELYRPETFGRKRSAGNVRGIGGANMGFRETLDTEPEAAKRAECTAQSAGIGIGITAVLR